MKCVNYYVSNILNMYSEHMESNYHCVGQYFSAWLADEDNGTIASLSVKFARVTGLTIDTAESLQVGLCISYLFILI